MGREKVDRTAQMRALREKQWAEEHGGSQVYTKAPEVAQVYTKPTPNDGPSVHLEGVTPARQVRVMKHRTGAHEYPKVILTGAWLTDLHLDPGDRVDVYVTEAGDIVLRRQ